MTMSTSIAAALLAEFEQEARTTRRFFERIPGDKLSWKPHEKSMTAGQLAMHIASVPMIVHQLANAPEFVIPDLRKPNPEPATIAELLAAHDASVAAVKAEMPALSDEKIQTKWRLIKDGKEVMAMPRAGFFRMIILNHCYHHRGQLGVYLRLMGAKVPSAYGPSGDEMPDFK